MEINNIIDQIEAWMDEDTTHTSAFVICTTNNDKTEAPNIHSYVNGNKNDALKALAYTAYENPEFEKLLKLVLTAVSILHKEDKAQDRKEASHAS